MLNCYDDIINNPEKYPDIIFKKVSNIKRECVLKIVDNTTWYFQYLLNQKYMILGRKSGTTFMTMYLKENYNLKDSDIIRMNFSHNSHITYLFAKKLKKEFNVSIDDGWEMSKLVGFLYYGSLIFDRTANKLEKICFLLRNPFDSIISRKVFEYFVRYDKNTDTDYECHKLNNDEYMQIFTFIKNLKFESVFNDFCDICNMASILAINSYNVILFTNENLHSMKIKDIRKYNKNTAFYYPTIKNLAIKITPKKLQNYSLKIYNNYICNFNNKSYKIIKIDDLKKDYDEKQKYIYTL